MQSTNFKLFLSVLILASCSVNLKQNENQYSKTNETDFANNYSDVKTKESTSINIDSLYVYDILIFPTGSSISSSKQEEKLRVICDFLRENDDLKLSLEGHTHSDGMESSNLTLSSQRAKAVYDFLIHEGINANRMSYIGYGEERPKESNETAYGKSRNSRVEIVVVE